MGKETVLALLLREKGHFVSGEAVSAELGITRAAIWKSISALRAQEYGQALLLLQNRAEQGVQPKAREYQNYSDDYS